ncbi:MAG: hypothetical protein ACI9TK_000662 [Flavobacteriaceae bacterium]|jgi:hypothetical protein|tara:strand:+ start:6379 stop:6771 length:393 start_codon:yes stop_codon:yes gene_type:complete
MNPFSALLLVSLFSVQAFSQASLHSLNYSSELPFHTSRDSEYYHLETSMLIRSILTDMVFIIIKDQDETKDVRFLITFKSNNGAELPLKYVVASEKIEKILKSDFYKDIFREDSYDWINRSFRTNIAYKE